MIHFLNKKLLLLVVSVVFLAGCNLVGGGGGSDGGRVSDSAAEEVTVEVEGKFVKGEKAPRVVVESFGGGEVDLSENYGERAVVIDFWAGWCPFCVAELPELQKAQDKYGDKLIMVGAHRTDTESVETGEKFADERGVSYLLVKDDGSLYRAAEGIGMPVAVFIDSEGVVAEIKSGPKTVEEIEEKVGGLLTK